MVLKICFACCWLVVKSFARVVKIAFLVDTIVCSELFFESSQGTL